MNIILEAKKNSKWSSHEPYVSYVFLGFSFIGSDCVLEGFFALFKLDATQCTFLVNAFYDFLQ